MSPDQSLPRHAAWHHHEAREGFEVVFFDGRRAHGSTAAVEEGQLWIVAYEIELDAGLRTRRAQVRARSATGARELSIEADGNGRWRLDGAPAPHLDGCLDVDLESSAMTNAFPVRRLGLAPGEAAEAPAAYVRALDLSVERLEQHYARVEVSGAGEAYDYSAPAFGVAIRLVYDVTGLVLDYPGLARRGA
jgi:uncharacterized protein